MMRMTDTVKQLLIINILFYIGSQFSDIAYPLFSLFFPENDNFYCWQPLTSMFMHAPFPNLMHIVFNMFALVSFGSALEHFWGAKKFLFFYISCGLGAALLHVGVNYWEYHNAVSTLEDAGVSKEMIAMIAREGRYNSQLLEFVSLTDLKELYNSYSTPAMGASGGNLWFIGCFCLHVPQCRVGTFIHPSSYKSQVFCDRFVGN